MKTITNIAKKSKANLKRTPSIFRLFNFYFFFFQRRTIKQQPDKEKSKILTSKNNNDSGTQLIPASHFNINVTNLTNSLIVNQNAENSQNPVEIQQKLVQKAHHKKSKSQGAAKNIQNTNSINSNNLKKNPILVQNYKTSQEFFQAKAKK